MSILSRQLARAHGRLTELDDEVDMPDRLRGQYDFLKSSLEGDADELTQELSILQQTSRLVELCLTGAGDNEDLVAVLDEEGEPSWEDAERVPIEPEQAKAIALQLFKSSRARPGERILIATTAVSKPITEEVVKLCIEHGVDFDIDFQEPARLALLVKTLSDAVPYGDARSPLQVLADIRLQLYRAVGKSIRVLSNPDPRIKQLADPDKDDVFTKKTSEINQRLRSGALHYILTYTPTPQDAALDGMDYEEYLRFFLEACDQPWDEIKQAQTRLVEKLNRARKIHITNYDGTNITLDITGQTFANSVVLKNLPGSEIFSSPLREGVNGRIVSKGRFQFKNSGVIENITLVFKDGRIVDFDAEVGREALARIIEMDDGHGEGSRHLGEIGIGTNPHLRRHLINPLLVEKIGGSFHVALGSCYSYTEYDGQPVSLQNGNKSEAGTHWDVTTLLRGKDGMMELIYDEDGPDRELVQRDGEWLVEGCNVLNKGWNALPGERRPQWWKERYPDGYLV